MTAVTSPVGMTHQESVAARMSEFRAALEEQRMFRIEQLTELAAPTAAAAGAAADVPRDEVAHALRAAATSALSDVQAALARIEAGSYGTCETCNGAIPLERLEILPMAGLCMRCAHANARQHRAG